MDSTPFNVHAPAHGFGWAGWVAVAGVITVLVWLGADGDGWRRGYVLTAQQSDYYNLLVDGLLDGELSMKVAKEPGGQLPYLLDASLHREKYYLYFGVVPAVGLFLPYAWLTGHDLPVNAASVLLVLGGFFCNLCLYQLACRRYFRELPSSWHICIVLLVAFGAGTPVLVMGSGMYAVAIAGGYLFLSGLLLAFFLALQPDHNPIRWLVVASLCGGLAVGCRPSCALALPVLLLPAWLHLRMALSAAGEKPACGRLTRLIGAAVIPAACIGVVLMAYNQARFGDPFEFGFKYQVNELMRSGLPIARPAFIWPNLKWYYLTPPALSPYFPYVLPVDMGDRPPFYYGIEMVHGQWLALVLGLWCLVTVIVTRHRSPAWPAAVAAFAGSGLLAFAAILLGTLTFGFAANRYVVDFQGPALSVLALAGSYTAAQRLGSGPRFGRLFRGGYCVLAVALAAFNLLASFQTGGSLIARKPQTYRTLARYGNLPAHGLERLGVLDYHSYRLRVRFVRPDKPRQEPLLATGTFGHTDVLFVTQYPTGHIDFGIRHTGHSTIGSEFMSLDYECEHDLEIFMGSFYPPPEHPYFDRWPQEEVTKARTTARVLLDGVEVISGNQPFFESSPGHVSYGHEPGTTGPAFSGKIVAVEPRPLPGLGAMQTPPENGLWRLAVEFRAFASQSPQPVLASGTAGHGNMLLVEYVEPGVIRFANDEWNYGLTRSPLITIDPGIPHVLEIFAGPQVLRQSLPPEWGIAPADLAGQASQLKVWLDGALVWDTPIRGNLESYGFVAIGKNPQGFSSTTSAYDGKLRRQPILPDDLRRLIVRALAPAPGPAMP